MIVVNIHEAKTHLSRLLQRVGEEISSPRPTQAGGTCRALIETATPQTWDSQRRGHGGILSTASRK